jgi:leucine dehydrogenase
MQALDRIAVLGHEEVLIVQDAASGLRGVVAIHDARPGPALAPTRLHPAATLEAALGEAVTLAEAVTREAALSDLARGGAAAVFVGPAAAEKSRPFLAAYGRVLDRLEGRVLASADMGFETRDLTVLARITRHVAHRRGTGADAAEATAQGVLEAIRAAAETLETALDEIHVAVQGLGQVGYRLARLLAAEGARLTVADVDAGRVERACDELRAERADAAAIFGLEVDVFSPNAGSGAIDTETLERLRCRAVVGSARAVLAEAGHGETLHARGILYAPDFIATSGGLASILEEDEMAVQERIADVGTRLRDLWARARSEGASPAEVAEKGLAARRRAR